MLTAGVSLVVATVVLGQTADRLVLQGRFDLTLSNIVKANAEFAAAVALSPDHQTANALLGMSRLFALPYSPPAQNLMDRLNMSLQGRNIYHWTSRLPRDKTGNWIPPNDFNLEEILAFVRTNVCPEIEQSTASFLRVKDPGFILNLHSNETTIGEVTLDYGDVKMLQAMLSSVQFVLWTITSYNFDTQLNSLFHLQERGEFTVNGILLNYPKALTFGDFNGFAAAKDAFRSAVDSYLGASEFIRNRPTNVVRLFNYDAEMADAEARFRQTLIEIQQSLSETVALSYVTNKGASIQANLGRLLDGSKSLREFLPQIRADGVVLGTLPDSTFGGALFGVSESDLFELISYRFHTGFIPVFESLEPAKGGRINLRVLVVSGRSYVIEGSKDLRIWTPEVHLTAVSGETNVQRGLKDAAHFYRVVDVSDLLEFSGSIVDSSGNAVPGALVSLAETGQQTITDAGGRFVLQTEIKRGVAGFYALSVAAAGFSPNSVYGYLGSGNQVSGLVLQIKHDPTFGTVIGWGGNGQMALLPSGLTTAATVSAGTTHNLALTPDGTVLSWGSQGNLLEPVPTNIVDVIGIAAGGAHNLALLTNHTVTAWGNMASRVCPIRLQT